MAPILKVLESCDQDIPALRELFLRVRIASFAWEDPSRFALLDFDRETSDEFIFVALADENIVGFVSVWAPDSFVHHLYVDENYQRQGVGTLLLEAVLDRFGPPIRLKCEASNEKAIRFYRKAGFIEVERGNSETGPYLLFELNEG